MNFSGYISLDSVPCKPDWRTALTGTIDFMKQMEKMAALQERIAKAV